MKKKSWINIKNINNDINVLPIKDIRLHIENISCSCNPRIEIIGSNLCIIHNAWDNRELFEEINEAIKNKTL
jgi:hypothetical protein